MSDTILQSTLREYHNLTQNIKQLQERKDALRGELIDALHAGADVEPGPFDLRLSEQRMQQLNWQIVQAILGDPAVRRLRAAIVPNVREALSVARRNPLPTPRPAQGVVRRAQSNKFLGGRKA